jgi:segregation and condensation protein A
MADKIELPKTERGKHEDVLFDMLVNKDEVTWQTIIHELVKQEKMDPWDINISTLASKFVEAVRSLQSIDFRISGKVVLAAAILLRIKSKRMLEEDLTALDRLIASSEQTEEEFYDELEQEQQVKRPEDFQLVPRTPQPRKRKVSIYDLINALNKALEVKDRRRFHVIPEAPEVKVPKNFIDINIQIGNVLQEIMNHYLGNNEKLTFSKLVPKEATKEEKIIIFNPLLHLANQRKVDLEQQEHFGEIEIILVKPKPEEKPTEPID